MTSSTARRPGLARVLLGRATLLPVLYSIGGVLPLFLVSSQVAALGRDLDLTRSRLGIAVGVCFTASALSATPLGHLTARLGPAAGLRLSAGLSLASLVIIGALATEWWHVPLALVLCGMANAAAQVASNLALAGGVPAARQGFAFGAKQAAIPVASLLAGLSLPVVALTAGWRAAFLGAAAIMAAAVLYDTGLASETQPAGRRARGGRTRLLLALAATGLLAGGVGNAVPAFAVDSAVARGIGESAAGLVLAMGSVMAVIGRLSTGWVADRRHSPGLVELAATTGVGVLAFAVLIASGSGHVLYVAAVLLAFATAWGWPGLIYFAAVRTHPATPGPASGFVLSWVYVGNVLGPLGVGFIAEHGSYRQAWIASGAVLLAATATALLAVRLERRTG